MALACGILIANAVGVLAVAFGLGMSSRPNDYGDSTVFNVPVNMLPLFLIFCVPGPLIFWLIFRSQGKSALGAVLALVGLVALSLLLREGVRV